MNGPVHAAMKSMKVIFQFAGTALNLEILVDRLLLRQGHHLQYKYPFFN